MEIIKCECCGNVFEKRYVYTDSKGKHICKYCYEGDFSTNDEGEFIEKEFIV